MKYFSYSFEDGLTLHETEEQAKECANNLLAYEREHASEGWSEGVDRICWGEVKQIATITEDRPRTDQDNFIDPCCDRVVSYELLNID